MPAEILSEGTFSKQHYPWTHQNITHLGVGDDGSSFAVHTFKLQQQSPTFIDCMLLMDNSLKDVDVSTIDIVVNWLYTGQFSKGETGSATAEVESQKMEVAEVPGTVQELQFEDEDAPVERSKSAIPEYNDEIDRKITPPATPTQTPTDRRSETLPPSTTSSILALKQDELKTLSNLEYSDIFKIYAFATKHDFPKLKVEAHKCWQRLSFIPKIPFPSRELINDIFTELPDDVYLTHYIAEQFVMQYKSKQSNTHDIIRELKGYHGNFLAAVVPYSMDNFTMQGDKRQTTSNWCTHHNHATEEERRACTFARKLEKEEADLRKRKNCLEENAQLKKRLKSHTEHFEKFKQKNPGKHINTLPVDRDMLLVHGPK